jgi:hypothetical protein
MASPEHSEKDQKKQNNSKQKQRKYQTNEASAPAETRYRKNAHAALTKYGETNSFNLPDLIGILEALRTDSVAGHLITLKPYTPRTEISFRSFPASLAAETYLEVERKENVETLLHGSASKM